jgi:endonuclease YncB( thermonuclease family)
VTIPLSLALLLLVNPRLAGELARVFTGPVAHVVDGDTIDVQLDGR